MKDSPMMRAGQATLAVVLAMGVWLLVLSDSVHLPHIHLSVFDGMPGNHVMMIIFGAIVVIWGIAHVAIDNHNTRVEAKRVARRDAHLAELRRQKESSQAT